MELGFRIGFCARQVLDRRQSYKIPRSLMTRFLGFLRIWDSALAGYVEMSAPLEHRQALPDMNAAAD
jgi:hypothetical protein